MSSRAMHDINVIGTLQLLGACERVPSLRTIVIRGSAGIYGAEPHAPQFFKEEMTEMFPLRTRFQRDVAEIENYFETFARRRPGVDCTMLRYQPAIGRGMRTQITRYLSQPVCPTYMGFDPRIQLVHIDDALEALVAAVGNPVRGTVNVACPGTIGLSRMIRLAGRRALPIAAPLFGAVTTTAQRLGLDSQSEDFQRLLRYGRGVDTARLTEDVGYTPRHSTVDAVESWVASTPPPRSPSCAGCAPASTRGSSCPRRSPAARPRSRATRARHSSGSSIASTATTRRTSGASTRTSRSSWSRSSRSSTTRGGA
jgi:UDP-glucose 4-epimerase